MVLEVLAGVIHPDVSFVLAFAVAFPVSNAPADGVTGMLHGCGDVVQVTPKPPSPWTVDGVFPLFCC